MDEAAIEKAGIDPSKRDLAAIDGLKSTAELAALLGRLHPAGASGEMFFGFGSGQDPKNASQVDRLRRAPAAWASPTATTT